MRWEPNRRPGRIYAYDEGLARLMLGCFWGTLALAVGDTLAEGGAHWYFWVLPPIFLVCWCSERWGEKA